LCREPAILTLLLRNWLTQGFNNIETTKGYAGETNPCEIDLTRRRGLM